MRKLSKTSWLMLMGGIVVITFAGLGMAYSRQTNDQTRLSQELAQARLILAKSSSDKLASQMDELEKRLAQRRSELRTLKADLSPIVQSIEASDSLFDIAETSSVEVLGTRSAAPSTQELTGTEYSVLSLKVKLEGDVANIIRFIRTWTEENPTGVVESVRINVPDILEEEGLTGEESGEGAEAKPQKPSANIELAIYTYQGD